MCFSFAEFEKNLSFEVLTLGAIGAKTRFFLKCGLNRCTTKTFYSLRPEDRLYGSNETKKCEVGPVVFSNTHFKVFKSSFVLLEVYIIDCIKVFLKAYYSSTIFKKAWNINTVFLLHNLWLLCENKNKKYQSYTFVCSDNCVLWYYYLRRLLMQATLSIKYQSC